VIEDGQSASLFKSFLNEHEAEFADALADIDEQLYTMAEYEGARSQYFRFEGRNNAEWVHAMRDGEQELRVYCCYYGQGLVILGNGGPKDVDKWQKDKELSREVQQMMAVSDAIAARMEDGGISLTPDGRSFTGNLQFKKDEY
jgi:hypothetical protein